MIESGNIIVEEVEKELVEKCSESEEIAEDTPEEIVMENSSIDDATAVIDNTPGDRITQADSTNLQDLVFRERHLQQNVVKLEFRRQEVRNLRNGKFKHMLELRLFVAPNNLWKGPRSYILKHLGENE